jgi:hypothetical protein
LFSQYISCLVPLHPTWAGTQVKLVCMPICLILPWVCSTSYSRSGLLRDLKDWRLINTAHELEHVTTSFTLCKANRMAISSAVYTARWSVIRFLTAPSCSCTTNLDPVGPVLVSFEPLCK